MGETTWTPTPAAPGLALLQSLIAGYVQMPDDDEVNQVALAGIRDAIDQINAKVWRWSLTAQDIDLTADTIDYPLESGFKKPRRMMLLDTADRECARIPFKSLTMLLDEDQGASAFGSGCPRLYTVANAHQLGTISFDCAPDAGFVSQYPKVRLWYFRRMAYPVEEGDTLDCPSEFTSFIQEWACGYVANKYDPSRAREAYGRASVILDRLEADDNDVQTDWE